MTPFRINVVVTANFELMIGRARVGQALTDPDEVVIFDSVEQIFLLSFPFAF